MISSRYAKWKSRGVRAWSSDSAKVPMVLAGGFASGSRLNARWKAQVTLVVSDEAFVGFAETPWGNADGLQENRARVEIEWEAAGIGWEAGYLNRYRNGVNGAEDTTDRNISLGISKEF